MPQNNRNLPQNLQKIMSNFDSQDITIRVVKEAEEPDDLHMQTTESTSMDPQDGRKTITTKEQGVFLPSGTYVPASRLQELEGRCVACQEEGTFTPLFGANGGTRSGCGKTSVWMSTHLYKRMVVFSVKAASVPSALRPYERACST